MLRAAEADSRAGALSAELQAAKHAEQACSCPGQAALPIEAMVAPL